MAADSPVKMKRVKDAIRAQVVTLLVPPVITDAIWSDQGAARPDRPFVAMRFTTAPRFPVGVVSDQEVCADAPDDVALTVDTLTVGRLYRLRLHGFAHDYVAQGGDTVDTVRDAWIASVNGDADEVATAASTGPGALLLTPKFAGALTRVGVIAAGSVTVTPNATTQPVIEHIGTRLLTCTFDVFTADVKEQTGAMELATRLISGFNRQNIRQDLFARRMGFRGPVSDPINLTGVPATGTKNEGRVTVDLIFAVASLIIEPIDTIETVATNILGDANTLTAP